MRGFRHELANRAFAVVAVRRMSERLQGDERRIFWATYWELEKFSAPRYAAAAESWGIVFKPGIWPVLKARIISSVPKGLLRLLLRIVHSETVKYLKWLQGLKQIGPSDASTFLDYMVEQEELQVEMMQLALSNRYVEIVERVDMFFLKHNGVISTSSVGA